MKTKIDYLDVEELAIAVCGLPEDSDLNDIDEALSEKFEVSFDGFHKLVEALVPLTPPARTVLGGKICHGFIKDDIFLVKSEIEG